MRYRRLAENEVEPIQVRLIGICGCLTIWIEGRRPASAIIGIRCRESYALSVLDVEICLEECQI